MSKIQFWLSCISATIIISLASAAEARPKDKLPPRPQAGVDHIVVVMMENRSFDHFLGWHPTADGVQAGLTYVDNDGTEIATYPLAPEYMGCEQIDPDHTWEGGRTAYNDGAMDGFLRAESDEFAVGYYEEEDRPFFNQLALHYTTFDRFFSSILGETYPNRFFMHAAQTDRIDNSLEISTLPTIWDRLLAKAAEMEVKGKEPVTFNYYFSDVPFLLLWGAKYLPIMRHYGEFLEDAAAGTLPNVSFVEPRFINDQLGTSGSDHPHGDIRVGDAFLAEVFHALANGPDWGSTVLIITYDEWGGFFDHVAPPRAAAPNDVDPDIVDGKALLGFRIPVVVASPFTRGDANNPRVDSTVFDNTSILKLIEWRWNLKPLTARDASSDVGNLLDALDLNNPDTSIPALPDPSPPVITPCIALPDDHLSIESILSLPFPLP